MTTIAHDTEFAVIPLEQLVANPDNLRQDHGDLTDLAASINAVGIIEPLVVENLELGTPSYLVLAGHRRLAAAQLAGLATAPCVVRIVNDDAERIEIQLVENLQRTGLNPIEEAAGYHQLTECSLTQREIAERVGCNQSHVSKRLKLHRLPDAAKPLVIDGTLTVNEALELVDLVDLDETSAGEWLAAPGWPSIRERIRRAEVDQRTAAARAEGEASGLPEWTGKMWDFDEVDREQATHWVVSHLGALAWGVERAEEDEADEVDQKSSTTEKSSTTKPSGLSEWEIRQQAAKVRRERRDAWITSLDADQLPAIAAAMVMACMRADEYSSLDIGPRVLEPLGVDINDTDDQALVWLIGLASAFHIADPADAEECPEFAEILDIANLHGYGLDEAEQAAVDTIDRGDQTPDPDPALVDEIARRREEIDTLLDEGDAEPTIDDAVAEAFAEDDAANTPPWKAYPYVDTTKLIAGIAEHTNPAKLRAALVYEQANDDRPPVIAALRQRIDVLEAAA